MAGLVVDFCLQRHILQANALSVALNDKVKGLACTQSQSGADITTGKNDKVIDLHQLVAHLKTGLATVSKAIHKLTQGGIDAIIGRNQQDQQDQHTGNEVHCGTGNGHQKTLQQGCFHKRNSLGLGGVLPCCFCLSRFAGEQHFGLILAFALHHHGAAQRQRADGIHRATDVLFPNGRAKANGKLQHSNAAELCHQKMAQFVHENQQAKHKNRQKIGHDYPFIKARARARARRSVSKIVSISGCCTKGVSSAARDTKG